MLRISFWLRVWNIELTLVPSLQIKPRKYSAENMCDIVFEKALGRVGKVNRTRSSRPKGKGFMRNFSELTLEHLCWNLFLDKIKLSRSATWLKSRYQSRCFFVKFTKFVGTHFLHGITGRLLLIVAVSIVVKGELANKTVNY